MAPSRLLSALQTSNIHIALGPILDVLRVCRDIHSDARGFLHVTNMSSGDRPVTAAKSKIHFVMPELCIFRHYYGGSRQSVGSRSHRQQLLSHR